MFVNGHLMKPGANLEGVDFTDADLRGVNLEGANLRFANLTDADLSGANLTSANLTAADLTGAKFVGTRLLDAQVFTMRGGDFSRAHQHPFFSEEEPESVEEVRLFYGLRTRMRGKTLRGLVATPWGKIWGIMDDQSRGVLTKTGAYSRINSHENSIGPMVRLGLTSTNFLVSHGTKGFVVTDLNAVEGGAKLAPGFAVDFQLCVPYGSPEPAAAPSGACEFPDGGWAMAWPDGVRLLNIDELTLNIKPALKLHGYTGGPLANGIGVPLISYIDGENRNLATRSWDPITKMGWTSLYPLVDKDLPDLLVQDCDRCIWTAKRGGDQVICYSLTKATDAYGMVSSDRTFSLPSGSALHHIALGPDGNLWGTLPNRHQLFRFNPDGTTRDCPLPEGIRPMEILNFEHGKLLFTTEDGDILGSIRAISSHAAPSQGLTSGDQAQSVQGSSNDAMTPDQVARLQEQADRNFEELIRDEEEILKKASPGFKKGSQNRASRAKAERAAEETMDAPEAPPAPAGPAPAQTESAKAPLAADLRMARLGIVLSKRRLHHILDRHAHGQDPDASWFGQDYSTQGPLKELLAAGLASAHQFGPLARTQRWDDRERKYTVCTSKGTVGTYLTMEGQVKRTRTFVVVTADRQDSVSGRSIRQVVTAFPVSPTW